jgi:hypothetical protein
MAQWNRFQDQNLVADVRVSSRYKRARAARAREMLASPSLMLDLTPQCQ